MQHRHIPIDYDGVTLHLCKVVFFITLQVGCGLPTCMSMDWGVFLSWVCVAVLAVTVDALSRHVCYG